MQKRWSTVLKGLGVLVGLGAIGTGWVMTHASETLPRVIRPRTVASSVPGAVSVVTTTHGAWQTLQTNNQTIWAHQWIAIQHHLPALRTVSQGQIPPSLVGWPTAPARPAVTVLGLSSVTHQWRADLSRVPRSVAPSLPVATWQTVWRETPQIVAEAFGPDPGQIVRMTGPHAASHFTRWVDHRYQVWAERITQHIWASQLIIAIGTVAPTGHPAMRWGVYRAPSSLSTPTVHVISLTRVPFVVNVVLQAPHHSPSTTVRTGWVIWGLVRTPHHWRWVIEGIRVNPGHSVTNLAGSPVHST